MPSGYTPSASASVRTHLLRTIAAGVQAAGRQRFDDVAQRAQRLVDVGLPAKQEW